MRTFVIKVYEFGVGDQLYVCEDGRLWDWLIAEDVLIGIPAEEDELVRVLAPEGFAFFDVVLMPMKTDGSTIYYPIIPLQEFSYVSTATPDADKVQMLLTSPFGLVSSISEKDLETLGVSDDRIFAVTVC